MIVKLEDIRMRIIRVEFALLQLVVPLSNRVDANSQQLLLTTPLFK
jgi:hypothetical protein